LIITAYEWLTTIIDLISLKHGIPLRLNIGTGVIGEIEIVEGKVNVGYFQSSKVCENPIVKSELMEMKIARPSEKFLELESSARETTPIVVHIRLGDYLLENSFGIPSSKYYATGIQYLLDSTSNSSIWLFSNNPLRALDLIPSKFRGMVFVVPDEALSSAETLELMRFGSAYVIANSTFSWWGAMLSHTKNAPVIIPVPWFKSGKDPEGICPENWIQINAEYSDRHHGLGDLNERK
jgi:hypothetical protein